MEKPFELLDIFGDAGIRARGRDLQELFRNAADGMYSLITDTATVSDDEQASFSLSAESLEGLLVSFLNELVFRFDTYGFVGKNIRIDMLTSLGGAPETPGFRIEAAAAGGTFDPDRHERRLLIKAATYHKLKIRQHADRWEADIIFDI